LTGSARRAGAALLVVSLACAHLGRGAPPAPPFPLTSAEPHVEPDLVGAVHVVRRGETLYRIARTYGVTPLDLLEVNGLADPRQLEVGMELFVPGAPRALEVPPAGAGAPVASGPPAAGGAEDEDEGPFTPGPALPPGATPPGGMAPGPPDDRGGAPGRPSFEKLRWPVQGVLYSRFGVRQGQRHDGIDIAAPEGTPIGAAAAGTVVYAGSQAGYGSIVILRHDGGLLTLYAHASALLVHQGDRVAPGQPIAKVGRSGRTSGPHLHFEVRDGTRPRNPLFYLP
jgi:lipoprotein NlpD